jgi:hypothetical protein
LGLQWQAPEMETCGPTKTEDWNGFDGFERFPQAGRRLRPDHRAHFVPATRLSVAAAVIRLAELRPVPEFPELQRFLTFWQEKLEGPLHSVRVAHRKLIKPAELNAIEGEFRLH